MVQPPEDGGGVGAAPGQSGADGDGLVQGDGQPAPVRAGVLRQAEGRGGGQIAPVGGEEAQIAAHGQGLPRAGLQPEPVAQIHGLHHHAHLVVPVGPLLQHVQGEIQFGVGQHIQRGHGSRLLVQ